MLIPSTYATYAYLLYVFVVYIGVRTMLEAIISFMPSEGNGAIGALDWSKAERQRLAKEVITAYTLIAIIISLYYLSFVNAMCSRIHIAAPYAVYAPTYSLTRSKVKE